MEPADLPGVIECLKALGASAVLDAELVLGPRRVGGTETWVADDGGRVVGTASVFFYRTFLHGGATAAHVEDVAVLPAYRGQGVGRGLMEAVLALCKRRGCYKAVLNCSAANEGFYRACGLSRSADSFMRADL